MESQQRGLLSGIGEMKAAQYYSDSISVDKAASLVLDEKRLFNICLENDQGDREKMQATLTNVVQNASLSTLVKYGIKESWYLQSKGLLKRGVRLHVSLLV